MNIPDQDPDDRDPLVKGARVSDARNKRWLQEGGLSVGRRLAQIGVLGWIIVVPMLIGVFLGSWLDRIFSSGLFWTAPLLIVGSAFGCWSGWKWMKSP